MINESYIKMGLNRKKLFEWMRKIMVNLTLKSLNISAQKTQQTAKQ